MHKISCPFGAIVSVILEANDISSPGSIFPDHSINYGRGPLGEGADLGSVHVAP